MTTPSNEADATLEFQKYLRKQIGWIEYWRTELKRIPFLPRMIIDGELSSIRRGIEKLREDEDYYDSQLHACKITVWSVYVFTTSLVDKAKNELSELEGDLEDLFKRY